MSNYLAIATVTAALQKILQEEVGRDVPGVQVTTTRPDNSGSNVAGACINIYLYQATPNPAWRNADLRTRRPKGDLTKHGQAALDLHYLFTFYGNEQALEPQRLMGSAIRTLVDHPLLTQEVIEEIVVHSGINELQETTLGDQMQQVKFIPSTITTEDLSRIWSVFFQVPYALSFAYQATAILIQGEKSGQLALPVRQRVSYINLGRPVLEKIEHKPLENQAALKNTVTLSSYLILYGQQLSGEDATLVQIGQVRIAPQTVTETEVHVQFSAIAPAARSQLRAGGPGIQVVRLETSQSEVLAELGVESNVLPFVLCPQIVAERGIELTDLEQDDESQRCSGQVSLQIDLSVERSQRVFLLLNGISSASSETYIFRAERRSTVTQQLTFPFHEVSAGRYLVRVQIDGAESPLSVDAQGQYASPLLVIA